MAAATATVQRGPVLYRENRRTSASSSVSPFNSHRCPSSVLGASFVLLPVFSLPFLASLRPPRSLFPGAAASFSFSFSFSPSASHASPDCFSFFLAPFLSRSRHLDLTNNDSARSFSNIRSPYFGRSP